MTNEVNRLLDLISVSSSYDYFVPGADRVVEALVNAITNGHHIVLDPDSDVDGVVSTLQFIDLLESLGYGNYSIVKVPEKRHGIDGNTITAVIERNSKLLIVTDSSSDKMDIMNQLCEATPDLTIIHIDHHIPDGTVPHKNIVQVVSHSLTGFPYKDVSCGLLCYLILKPMFDSISPKLSREMESLAYASVITDVIPMSSDELVKFMTVAKTNTNLHPLLTAFMYISNDYRLSREFIMFNFAPKLNSLFRMNRLDLLYSLLYIPKYKSVLSAYSLHEVFRVHKQSNTLKLSLIPEESPDKHGEFLFLDISERAREVGVNAFVAKNYTGLIASEYANKYKMPVVCSIKQGSSLKGSVRDYFGRNLLYPVSNFLDARGHKPAFGFVDSPSALSWFKKKCDAKQIELVESFKKDICVNVDQQLKTSITAFMDILSTYSMLNELGTSVPNAFMQLAMPYGAEIKNHTRYSIANYKGIEFRSFSGRLHPKMLDNWKPTGGILYR